MKAKEISQYNIYNKKANFRAKGYLKNKQVYDMNASIARHLCFTTENITFDEVDLHLKITSGGDCTTLIDYLQELREHLPILPK